MPVFDTPEPVVVVLELGVGDVRILATERADTVVEVGPTDAAKKSDAAAAEQVRVEYAAGRLLVKASKGWRQWTFRAGGESIDVQIALPVGSHVRGGAGIATLRCTGRLGECRYQTGIGDIQLDEAGPVELKTGVGDITADRLHGHTELTTGSGTVRVAAIDGTAAIKNSNGDTWVGEATGDLRVNGANGSISVDLAHAAVTAKTARGDVRLDEVTAGSVLAQTGLGELDIGVRDGVAAWLELNTGLGKVHNSLAAADRPQPGEPTLELRASSSCGDISIRRSRANRAPAHT